MRRPVDKYASYVKHPRFGSSPRFTGLDADIHDPDVHLLCHSTSVCRIAGTAIHADPSRQHFSPVPVTHYYDLERVCRDCRRPFLFFAEEQRYWYETLRFKLNANCVRCYECRVNVRALARKRATYERLIHKKGRDWKESVVMAESALTLVEQGLFHKRQVGHIRALLKTVPAARRSTEGYLWLRKRLAVLSRTGD
jgi:hypothetical protein